MKKKLELKIMLNSRKKLEFKQTMECLTEVLSDDCSDLKINESHEGDVFTLIIHWESANKMRQALRTEEFSILTGAINSLAKSTAICFDDKDLGNDISKLMSL